MFDIFLTSKAEKQIKDVPKNILLKIVEAIENLKSTYYPSKYDIKKMKDLEHSYRIRIGNWRILYNVDFDSKEIFIVGILPRKKAYKK